MSAQTVTANRVHVQEAGDQGPLLLCLHGIGSSSAAFGAQMAELSAYVRVVAWDAPGYAESPDPEEPLDLDGFADAAAEVIRERAADAHVLGVSWGGVIALRLATRHPDLVRSLIVADSSTGSGTDAAKAAGMRARADELSALGPKAFAESRGPRLVSANAPDELVRRVVATMAASVRLPGYGYAAESMASADLRADLPDIAAPTLVICGEHDTVTGVEAGQAIAGAIHKSAYVIVKDAGHLANQEQPAAFDAWVLSHLRITDRIPGHIARPATEHPTHV